MAHRCECELSVFALWQSEDSHPMVAGRLQPRHDPDKNKQKRMDGKINKIEIERNPETDSIKPVTQQNPVSSNCPTLLSS